MADKGQALRPAIFNIPSFQKPEEVIDKETLTKEEQILAAGAEQAFWLVLRKHIENCIEELDEFNNQAVISGAALEEIGRNTVVINLTKGVLKRIFDKVDDARELLERTNGQGK